MNKIIITAAAALLTLLSACGKDEDEGKTAFVAACVEGVGADLEGVEDSCSCMYDVVSEEMSEDQMAMFLNFMSDPEAAMSSMAEGGEGAEDAMALMGMLEEIGPKIEEQCPEPGA